MLMTIVEILMVSLGLVLLGMKAFISQINSARSCAGHALAEKAGDCTTQAEAWLAARKNEKAAKKVAAWSAARKKEKAAKASPAPVVEV